MNTQQIADKVAEGHGISKADARKVVDLVFETIASAVASDSEVVINGFGKFSMKHSPAREGRNPATGEALQIAAKNKPAFSPAKGFKDQVAG